MSDQEESCHEGEKELCDSDTEESASLETKSNVEVQESMNKISIYFREFDLSLIKFVELELNTNPSMVPDTSERSDLNRSAAKLNPHLLLFILNDVNKKLAIVLKPKSTSKLLGFPSKPNKTQLFLQLNNVNSRETALFLLENCFEKLCDNLDIIFKYIKAIQHKNDDIRDPPEIQNNQNNICLLKCFNQIIKFIHILFLWVSSVNDSEINSKILNAVNVLGSKEEIPRKNSSVSTQLEKYAKFLSLKYLNKLSDICLDLYSADILAQLMDLLFNKIFVKHFNLDENGKKLCRHLLAETCKVFLKNDFTSKIVSKQAVSSNESVQNILNTFLKHCENPIEKVNDFAKIITGDAYREDRQSCSDFETLKTNFGSYFKVLLEYTVNNLNFDILKNYDLKKNGLDDSILVELVHKINDLVNVHCNLIYLKKHVTFKEINILTLLKNSRLFINNFLKYTMPVLDKAFDGYKAEVVNILQNVQKSVHFLQELCLAKDQSSISKQMPVYIRTIEAFSLRVKQLLYINSCDGAFTVDFEKFKLAEAKVSKKKGKVLKEKSVNKKEKKNKKGKHAEENEETNLGNEVNDEDIDDDDVEEEVDEDDETENDDD